MTFTLADGVKPLPTADPLLVTIRNGHYFVVDKGYSSRTVWCYLRGRQIAVVILTKANESPDTTFDREAYRERAVVERLINRLKQWRRIATRCEKRAVNFQAMLILAAIMLWL